MFATLDRFLAERFDDRTFKFADLGCGDATAVVDTLGGKSISHYIGVDAGAELIEAARTTLASIDCQKTFLCGDMAAAISEMPEDLDIILCSYSVHHLLLDQKIKFIRDCHQKLNSSGYFIMVDGVSVPGETRDAWLDRLDSRIQQKVPGLTEKERAQLMQHPRDSDHPETIETFRRIANQTGWRDFAVLVERDRFLAFMVFAK